MPAVARLRRRQAPAPPTQPRAQKRTQPGEDARLEALDVHLQQIDAVVVQLRGERGQRRVPPVVLVDDRLGTEAHGVEEDARRQVLGDARRRDRAIKRVHDARCARHHLALEGEIPIRAERVYDTALLQRAEVAQLRRGRAGGRVCTKRRAGWATNERTVWTRTAAGSGHWPDSGPHVRDRITLRRAMW